MHYSIGILHIREGLYTFKIMTGLHKYTQKVSTTIVHNAKTIKTGPHDTQRIKIRLYYKMVIKGVFH